MKITVTGACGYVGARLVPQLLEEGHEVIAYDAQYFGRNLPEHPGLTVVKADIRDTAAFSKAVEGSHAVLHLACISNDASFELDEALSRTVNYECFEPLVLAAKKAGVQRFIYASSSSVYGVSDAPDVTEEHPLVPLTLYNKYKGLCEPLLFEHASDDFMCTVIRPATVCGYSPRMRLDLSVNILTNHAITNREILVFGGSQTRPNLHIQDMCDVYRLLLQSDLKLINRQTFNVGMGNYTIEAIANKVKEVVESQIDGPSIPIRKLPSNDPRSYRINSDKIAKVLGFRPCYTIELAIRMMAKAFRDGKIPNSMTNKNYYNVQTMKAFNGCRS